jgi:hypothetical protein
MSARQAEMFGKPTTPRVHRAHVVDAGHGPGPGRWAEFECSRCGWRSEWRHIENITEGKRGVPCPNCNARAALEAINKGGK